MNPLQRMELHKATFTQNDQIIYDHIMQDPSAITHMSTSTLAELCGVSQPALSRFVKSLGYSRYQDFRAELIIIFSTKQSSCSLRSICMIWQTTYASFPASLPAASAKAVMLLNCWRS